MSILLHESMKLGPEVNLPYSLSNPPLLPNGGELARVKRSALQSDEKSKVAHGAMAWSSDTIQGTGNCARVQETSCVEQRVHVPLSSESTKALKSLTHDWRYRSNPAVMVPTRANLVRYRSQSMDSGTYDWSLTCSSRGEGRRRCSKDSNPSC